jgi:hypothetical protein
MKQACRIVGASSFLLLAALNCSSQKMATCPVSPAMAALAPKACAGGTRPAADGVIDDFEDGDNQVSKNADRDGYWFTAHDPNGSTIDPSPFKISDGGAGSPKGVHIMGHTSGENGAWGSQLGANFSSDSKSVYDASKYAGISFKAKIGGSSTKKVRFKLGDINTHPDGGVCKSCWNLFGKDLTLTNEWQEYKITFAEMKQEPGWGDPQSSVVPSKLFSLNWSIGPGQNFDIWIDDLQFVECM